MLKGNELLNQPSVQNATLIPNPVGDNFVVSLPLLAEDAVMRIIDLQGRVLNTINYKGSYKRNIEINSAHLPPGVYLLLIETKSTKQTLRFIKR